MRLGLGEFHEPGPHSIPEAAARQAFLLKVQELAPHVLDDLRRTVLPRYPGGATDKLESSDRLFQEALENWADKHYLSESWITQHAEMTLAAWSVSPSTAEHQEWGAFTGGAEWIRFSDAEVRAPTPPPWHPQHERWNDYRRRVGNWFRDALVEYRSKIEELAIAKGLERAPSKRGIMPDRDFAWLVRWQVLGWSYSRIGGVHHKPTTVRKALQRTAKQIGLRLHPARRSGVGH